MSPEVELLLITVMSVAVVHTLIGPDHYLPFIALAKSGNWSLRKTIGWTIICGSGHVFSSILLGLIAAAIGYSLNSINLLQSIRGGLAAWMLLSFGVVYTMYGLLNRGRRSHRHFDMVGGETFVFEHTHGRPVAPGKRYVVTPWVLFLIFVLGPCEPMIPLLYLPVANSSWMVMAILIFVYTVCTLGIMVSMVLAGFYGLRIFKNLKLEKYLHAISGISIILCALGMLFLNW